MSIGGISGGTFDLTSLKALRHEKGLELFKKNDTDKSGGISISEFQKAHETNPLAPLSQAKNTDQASLEEIFAHLDADGNGEIGIKEFRDAKPPAPGGNFAPDTLASLLQLQEKSSENPFQKLVETASNKQDTNSDLLDGLLKTLSSEDKK
jgi:hypothetical protein